MSGGWQRATIGEFRLDADLATRLNQVGMGAYLRFRAFLDSTGVEGVENDLPIDLAPLQPTPSPMVGLKAVDLPGQSRLGK